MREKTWKVFGSPINNDIKKIQRAKRVVMFLICAFMHYAMTIMTSYIKQGNASRTVQSLPMIYFQENLIVVETSQLIN